MEKNVYLISGIDTDAGRSYATSYLVWELNRKDQHTITQKFTRTGNTSHSENIDLHRRIMNIVLTDDDQEGLAMPETFSYPCSPRLASRIDERPIDFDKIERATEGLSHRCSIILLGGAGGLMVPLTEKSLTIDYVAQKGYPLLFVTSGKLGNINHTLLSLEAVRNRDIELDTVLYNLYPAVGDRTIQKDIQLFIRRYLKKHFPETKFRTVPEL